MKCRDVQHYVLEHAGEKLEAPYVEHLRVCAECRRAQERADSLCKLLSLKRFEKPDPGFEVRCHDAAMRRIRNLDAEPAGWSLWDWVTMPQPALRYGMAAVVALLVGVNVYMGSRTPESPLAVTPDQIVAVPAPAPVAVAPQAFASAAPTSALSPSQNVFLAASSNRPNGGGVQYGPGASVPVGFNF